MTPGRALLLRVVALFDEVQRLGMVKAGTRTSHLHEKVYRLKTRL